VDFLPDSGEDGRISGEQNDKNDPPEPHSGFQSEGGDGRSEGLSPATSTLNVVASIPCSLP